MEIAPKRHGRSIGSLTEPIQFSQSISGSCGRSFFRVACHASRSPSKFCLIQNDSSKPTIISSHNFWRAAAAAAAAEFATTKRFCSRTLAPTLWRSHLATRAAAH